MDRIFQSRRKLTASIASATRAEDELRGLSQSSAAKPFDSATRVGNTNQRKRPFEDIISSNNAKDFSNEQRVEKVESDSDGHGSSSLPPTKKASTHCSLDTTKPTFDSTPSSIIEEEGTSSATTSCVVQIGQAASITPTNEKAIPASNAEPCTDGASQALPETIKSAHTTAAALSPDRAPMAIDLTTPSPPYSETPHPSKLPISINSSNSKDQGSASQHSDEDGEIEIVPSTSIHPNPRASATPMDTTKDLKSTEDSGTTTAEHENDENDEEIQVVSSTTINPNIQYPHMRTDCGVFNFSTDPLKFCEKCYCLVCDIPAKECKQWGDHSSTKCRPAKKKDDEMTDDEGHDVTDEILLESPSTTARNYYNRSLPEQQAPEDRVENRRQLVSRSHENDSKLRILDVLSEKLKARLMISEGARSLMEEMDSGGTNTKKTNGRKSNGVAKRNPMEGDIPQLGLHSAFFVEGIKIGWPFPAIMLPQRQMAMHIIKGLKRKLHVVVESPTGTGKSVAILCSVLAWQRYHVQTNSTVETNAIRDDDMEEDEKFPKIIYCSRTHSQVTQMVASLKKTPYRPTMTILGSRKRMCIHKKLTGDNAKTNKMPLNQACQIRRMKTDADRKRRIKDHLYNDNAPEPMKEHNGDDLGENDSGEIEIPTDVDNAEGENNTTGRTRKPQPTCPHYRQLTSERTASMTIKRFMGGHRLKGCCGNSNAVGGEETTFGVHDMEDLVHFGKNPYKEENVAVYRGNNGKFGFLINNNTNESGETTRGCHMVSLVSDGAAAFEARLQDEDKILKINGKDVRTWNKRKVVDLLSQTPKNQPARLVVMRKCSDTPELLDPEKDLLGVEEGENPTEVYSESSVCPYYLSRAIQTHAELTFAPYNYILDPGIRRVMNISLKNAVVVLDEAHNVESTLCEGGSGKYGEIDLCQLVCTLGVYARRTMQTGNVTLINQQVDVDTAKVAHDLLMFVEKIILHLKALREKFANSPGRTKLEEDYRRYRNTPDNHEIELSYDGPTGYGIKGEAVGCQPFLTQLGITKEQCALLLEYALSMEQKLFGGKPDDDNANQPGDVVGESSNVLTLLVELLSKLLTATENAEHYYISCVAQANGNLEHALEIEDEFANNRRFKKKPRKVPFLSPRTPIYPTTPIPLCQHDGCNPTHNLFGDGVRHGEYCNGSTPSWECHLVLRLLSPGLLMRDLSQQCRSVILASGSLAPLPSVCAELNLFGNDSTSTPTNQKSLITSNALPTISQSMLDSMVAECGKKIYTNRLQTTPKPLEANHVINLQKQLLAVSIGHFPNGEKLTVSYSNYHNNPSFLPKFGHAVASVIDGVPKGGCLVFFPSYSFLKKCVSCWNDSDDNNNAFNRGRNRYFANNNRNDNHFIWERFLRSKGKVIVEPTGGQEEFEAARDEYKETIQTTGSCILLAVFRGKMSEGISFDDENSRAVICIGMPLPNWTDRSVKAKQAYNDEQRKLCKKTCLLPGRDFYNQQAYRAIAQALGRCIRHGADYGTVILMDSRHCWDGSPTVGGVCRAHSNLPKWMRGSVNTLSMEREDRRVMMRNGQQQHHQPKVIYGGYAGLKKEMRQFFAKAPIASQEVRDKWKGDRERALAASSRGSNVVFHRDTGNWTTVGESSSAGRNGGDSEKKQPGKSSIQI